MRPRPSSTPSPPSRRVVDVIELLAHPTAVRLTLAEICRRTGASRATMHAVTSELVEAGWLLRSDDGRFSTGPALRRIGSQVSEPIDFARLARPDLEALVDATGISGCALEKHDDLLRVVDVVQAHGRSPSPVAWPAGSTIPYRAPFGREWAAFDSREQIDTWFGRGSGDDKVQKRIGTALAQISERGWSLERMTPQRRELIQMAAHLESARIGRLVREQVAELFAELTAVDVLDGEIDAESDLAVLAISAPVLNARGEPVGAVALTPCRRMTSSAFRRTAAAVVECAGRLGTG